MCIHSPGIFENSRGDAVWNAGVFVSPAAAVQRRGGKVTARQQTEETARSLTSRPVTELNSEVPEVKMPFIFCI